MTKLAKTRGANLKIGCKECGWKGRLSSTREIQDPNDIDDLVRVCPNCGSMDNLDLICRKAGCWKRIKSIGPATEIYQVCYEHR